MQQLISSILEFLPVVVFFISYYKTDLITATTYLIISSLCAMLCIYAIKRHLPKALVISNIILVIFGSITIFSGDSSFIKMKPTILYLTLSCVLIYDLVTKKMLLKRMFSNFIVLEDKIYVNLSKQSLIFFILCAACNEIIWRNFSENTWVLFKTFGLLGLTFVYTISQSIILHRKATRHSV